MEKFNWEEFKLGRVAIHCDTEEKAKDFLEKCDTKGIKFKVRNRTTEGTNSWKWYKEQTIYCINNNKLLYSSYLERRAIGYKIIEWEINEIKEIEEANKDMSEFADYLIENASYAFETQDRELLEKVLLNYIDMKLKEQ